MRRTRSSRPHGGRRLGVVHLVASLLLFLLSTAGTAQEVQPPDSIGVRLVEIPASRADDPRAVTAIIDHLDPGATIQRRIEVVSTLDTPTQVEIYATGAEIVDGVFTPLPNDASPTVADWVSVEREQVALAAFESRIVEVAVAIPPDAEAGEQYGVIWVQPPAGGTELAITNRVGLRLYLSVGDESEPAVDYELTEMTAGRDPEGLPYVTTEIVNTGGRAVDVSGELLLSDGPAGLEAGPIAFDGSVSIAPGGRAPMRITLDPELPAGPWLGRLDSRSGLTERSAEATVIFPGEADATAEPVEADAVPVRPGGPVGPIVAGLFILVTGLLVLLAWRRRRDEDDDEHAPTATEAPPSGVGVRPSQTDA